MKRTRPGLAALLIVLIASLAFSVQSFADSTGRFYGMPPSEILTALEDEVMQYEPDVSALVSAIEEEQSINTSVLVDGSLP